MEITLEYKANAELGESPCWDYRNNELIWCDILKKEVNFYNPITKKNRRIELQQMVTSIGLTDVQDVYVVTTENGFHYLNRSDKELEKINDPEVEIKTNRFNDGKVDYMGRFWAGTMGYDGIDPVGSLYMLNEHKNIVKAEEGITISNGLAWDKTNRLMYFIDTPTQKVVAYKYNEETGTISNKALVIDIPTRFGNPDGMTIDSEGNLWIAGWGAGNIMKCDPNKGVLLDMINIPAKNVTSCTFGGEHLNVLFITSAQTGLTESELEEYPLSGSIFSINTDVKGTLAHEYKSGKLNKEC